jgi:hypothetical protein
MGQYVLKHTISFSFHYFHSFPHPSITENVIKVAHPPVFLEMSGSYPDWGSPWFALILPCKMSRLYTKLGLGRFLPFLPIRHSLNHATLLPCVPIFRATDNVLQWTHGLRTSVSGTFSSYVTHDVSCRSSHVHFWGSNITLSSLEQEDLIPDRGTSVFVHQVRTSSWAHVAFYPMCAGMFPCHPPPE